MLFKTRRSAAPYKDETVDRNVLLKALEEARYAPTASNCEEVAWLLVEGRDRLHDLASAWRTGCRRLPENTAMWHRLSAPGGIRSCGGPLPHPRARRRQHRGTLSTVPPPSAIWARPAQLRHRDLLERFRHRAASNGVNLGIPLPEGRKICGGLMIGYPAVQYARVPPRKPVRLTVIE
ncbi:MAG: nitroreductase family protein [Bilophila wadsworthia]